MKMDSRPWFPLFFLLLFAGFSLIKSDQDGNILTMEKEILDNILNSSKYDHRVRPVENNDILSPTVVRVNMFIRIINKIDDLLMQYSMQVTLRQKWLDPRLKFNNMDGKLKFLNLFDENIWSPDLFISNERSGYINNLMKLNKYVRIFPDGNVLYSARLSLVLSCPMNFELFPFDRQVCGMRLASYGYTTDDVVFLWEESSPVQIARNVIINHYSLENHTTSYCHSKTNTGSYSCLRTDFLLKRYLNYYMFHLFMPCTVLVFISWMVFWLDKQFVLTRLFVALTSLLVLGYKVADFNASVTPVHYTKSVDIWTGTCLMFVFTALAQIVLVDFLWRRKQKEEKRAAAKLDTTDSENAESIDLKPLVSVQVNNSTTENRNQHPSNHLGRVSNFYYRLMSNLPTGPKRLDIISRYLFPISFALFNVCFWIRNLA